MKLSEAEIKLFYKLYHPLLLYTARKTGQAKNVSVAGEIKQIPFNKLSDIRVALYGAGDLFEVFIAENPLHFSPAELETVRSWKNFIKDKFYVVRYLKDYAVFLTGDSPAKAYGVRCLYSSFAEVIGSDLPVLLETVLLPFQGKIIYDGLVAPYHIHFGSGIRQGINESYQKAKAEHGIITNFDVPVEEQTDVALLKFYLRTPARREKYTEAIHELIQRDHGLLVLYHQEMGKITATSYKKHLKESGVKNAWFGILDGLIIASGATKSHVEKIVQDIVPADKRDLVYVFQFKAKS